MLATRASMTVEPHHMTTRYDIAALKARLNKISTEVLGDDKVNDVLLQVVQQRPI